MRALPALAALLAALAAGCGGDPQPAAEAPAPAGRSAETGPPAGTDPRANGLEIALGEWALTAEVRAIRPGSVTFVVTNRGAVAHGFELSSRARAGTSG